MQQPWELGEYYVKILNIAESVPDRRELLKNDSVNKIWLSFQNHIGNIDFAFNVVNSNSTLDAVDTSLK